MKKYNSAEIANLIMILKLFEGQPHHLANFLIENGGLTESFRQKIKDSQNLSKLASNGFDWEKMYFSSIEEMKNYFESLLEIEGEDINETINNLESKLKIALQNEDYESAIRYRDHLKKLKRKKR